MPPASRRGCAGGALVDQPGRGARSRLRTIKRAMYGRASFDLLRSRTLPLANKSARQIVSYLQQIFLIAFFCESSEPLTPIGGYGHAFAYSREIKMIAGREGSHSQREIGWGFGALDR